MDHWVDGDEVWIRVDSVHGPFWKRLLSDHVQWHPPWERHCRQHGGGGCGAAAFPGCLRRAWCWRVSFWSTFLPRRSWQHLVDWDVRTWNLVHFLRVLVSVSHCSGCLGDAYEYENWILREMTFLRGCNAWFYSGYMFCVSSLAMDEFHTFFQDAADSNPEAFSPFGRMEKCAQFVLPVAVFLSAVHTWKLGSLFIRASLGCDA